MVLDRELKCLSNIQNLKFLRRKPLGEAGTL